MEKFETKTTTIEAETPKYNREVTEMMAMEEALDRLEESILLPAEQKIEAIQKLIDKLGATVEGTDTPLHNEHRHVVEALSRLKRVEESKLRYESDVNAYPETVQARTA